MQASLVPILFSFEQSTDPKEGVWIQSLHCGVNVEQGREVLGLAVGSYCLKALIICAGVVHVPFRVQDVPQGETWQTPLTAMLGAFHSSLKQK